MALSNSSMQGIKSVQSGVVAMSNLSGSVAIASINVSKSVIEVTGIATIATTSPTEGNPCISFTSATSFSWDRQSNTAGKFSWQIVEYF